MSEKREKVLAALAAAGTPYTLVEHPAAYTIEEMDALPLPHPEAVVKNLFLRDSRGKRHFLLVLPKDKRADLTVLRGRIGNRLGFASEARLAKYLGLTPGSVTPFGVLNDEERAVEVLFDSVLGEMPLVGVHPNENTATVFLEPLALAELIRAHGNPFRWEELPG